MMGGFVVEGAVMEVALIIIIIHILITINVNISIAIIITSIICEGGGEEGG